MAAIKETANVNITFKIPQYPKKCLEVRKNFERKYIANLTKLIELEYIASKHTGDKEKVRERKAGQTMALRCIVLELLCGYFE